MALLGSIKPSLSLLVTQVFTQVLTFVKLINLKFKMSAFYRKCVLLKDSIYLCTWSPLSKPSSSRVQLAHTPALLGVSTPKYPKGGWLSFSEKRERGGWRGRGLWRPPRLPSVSVTYRPSASGLPLDLPKDHFLRVKNNI